MSFDVEVAPRFDYGRRPHEFSLSDDGAIFDAGETRLAISLIREEKDERPARYNSTDEGDLHVVLTSRRARCAGSSWRRAGGCRPV